MPKRWKIMRPIIFSPLLTMSGRRGKFMSNRCCKMTPHTTQAFVTLWVSVSEGKDLHTVLKTWHIYWENWTVFMQQVWKFYLLMLKKKHKLKKKTCTQTHNQFSVICDTARSVWHWLLSANSTLGAALASFAANPGKEITDTHNAVFCSSAKKKTSPLSHRKKRTIHKFTQTWPFPRTKPRKPFFSKNMASNTRLAQWLAHTKAAVWLRQSSLHSFILVPNTVAHYYYLHHKKRQSLAHNQSHSHCNATLMAAVWLQTTVKKYERKLHSGFISSLNGVIKKRWDGTHVWACHPN